MLKRLINKRHLSLLYLMTTISEKQVEGVSEKSKSKLGLRELLNPFHDQQYLSLPHILDQNFAPTQIYRQEGPNALLLDRGSKELPMIHFTQELCSLVKWPLLPGVNQEHCIFLHYKK